MIGKTVEGGTSTLPLYSHSKRFVVFSDLVIRVRYFIRKKLKLGINKSVLTAHFTQPMYSMLSLTRFV